MKTLMTGQMKAATGSCLETFFLILDMMLNGKRGGSATYFSNTVTSLTSVFSENGKTDFTIHT